ncbi:MAG: T9SS type A sorting domain-containing protein, partial [Spirochaetes bacterium]|nr:T9SS type A sorting domain-containing protein [Spirochaetota bacterium]
SWITPDDQDYHYTAISYMSSSRYPDTPHEGQLVVKVTNAPNTYAEYFFNTSLGGYKYFSAFAMDQVDNHSEPAFANVFIIDKPVKLAGNLIHPADNNMQVKIYIDTYQAGQKVDIKIYNMKGKVMKSFGEKTLSPGRNQFVWPETEEQLNDIPSGIYILSVTGDIEQREKIVVVK